MRLPGRSGRLDETAVMPAPRSLGDRLMAVAPHVLGLLLITAGAVAVGRPEGWLAVLAPVGPVVAAVLARLTGRWAPGWRTAAAFGIVAAVLIAGGWTLMRLAGVHNLFLFLFPIALLGFLLGVVNYVIVSLSRGYRAMRGHPLDYPWIPDALAALLGLPPEGTSNGNR